MAHTCKAVVHALQEDLPKQLPVAHQDCGQHMWQVYRGWAVNVCHTRISATAGPRRAWSAPPCFQPCKWKYLLLCHECTHCRWKVQYPRQIKPHRLRHAATGDSDAIVCDGFMLAFATTTTIQRSSAAVGTLHTFHGVGLAGRVCCMRRLQLSHKVAQAAC